MMAQRTWRRLGVRVAQRRRDLRMVALVLTGGHPGPLVQRVRPGQAWADPSGSEPLESATVVQVRRETPSAVSLWLERDGRRPWQVAPGQFLLLTVPVDGTSHRRAYSISGVAAEDRRVRVTVKRIAGGTVSTFIDRSMRPGQRLRVEGPAGRFVWEDGAGSGRLLLIGGGSGITPLRAIAEAALDGNGSTEVGLIYGNSRPEEIIFARELAALRDRHSDRLTIRHVLAERADELGDARSGVLDEATLGEELDRLIGDDPVGVEAFCCGPPPVMAAARAALLARGVPPGRIREERFVSPTDLRREQLGSTGTEPVTLRRAAGVVPIEVEPGETILGAAQAAGVALPHSCAMGGCGACKVALREGQVDLAEPNCLTAEEQARGEILTCVAHPRGPVTLQVPS